MTKQFTHGVLCLMIGGVMGYQSRALQQAAKTSIKASDVAVPTGAAQAAGAFSTSGQAANASGAGGDPPPAEGSLDTRMRALLEFYNDGAARKVLGGLSAAEIQTALTLVAAMPKSSDRDSLRANLYRAWAKTNPRAAWKAALADTLASDRNNLSAVAGELAKTRPDEAVGLALSLGMGSRRATVFQELFEEWGSVDLAGAVAYLNKHPDLPAAAPAISNAIDSVGEKDPLRAANLALTLTDLQSRSYAISSLVNQWASSDPKSALSWAQALSNPVLRQTAISQAISGWAQQDPQAALVQAQTIQDPGTRSSAVHTALYDWFEKDPTAAVIFMANSGDEKMLQDVRRSVANGLASFTEQETASLLEKLPDGNAKQEIIQSLADAQIRKGQYRQALEQLNSVPDSANRDSTLQHLGQKWAEADPDAAAAWLRLQPDSSDRDVAVAGFAAALARTDPQGALQWADTIPDADVKAGALKNIALRWLTSDPASAEAWLSGASGWSDSDKQNVRDEAQRAGPDRFSFTVNVSNRR